MMKSIVRWSVDNAPAINVLVIAVLLLGAYRATSMQREFWPYSNLDIIQVSVVYQGASPEEIEQAICQRIEESVRSVDGVRRITSVSREGSGTVQIELAAEVNETDVQEILADVRARVDSIPSFPALAEEPEIARQQPRSTALQVGVVGPDDDSVGAQLALRELAERIRSELLLLPEISQAEIVGAPEFQIDIEIAEETLRQYNLTLAQVAEVVRNENIEIPGGTLRTGSQEILLRGSSRQTTGTAIANIPVITQAAGTVLTIGDLGNVRDEFTDDSAISRINRRPGLAIQVDTTATEDIVDVGKAVHRFFDEYPVPDGFSLLSFRDRTGDVEARLMLLVKNGWQGLLLVFLLLMLFLELRLAFWVAMGIPLSIAGACIAMYHTGQTFNMTSLFAFLIALGIMVDDAIVIGENIYVHRTMGKDFRRAAIDGTFEVMPAVVTSVLTTVIAFLPMLFMTGRLARFTQVLPLAVIALLLFSLAEACTVLPSHLAHKDGPGMSVIKWLFGPFRWLGTLIGQINGMVGKLLELFIERVYLPALRFSMRTPALVISVSLALLFITFGVVRSGIVPYIVLPQIDSNFCTVVIAYPDGTPERITSDATRKLEQAIYRVNQQTIEEGLTLEPSGVVGAVHRSVGYGANTFGVVSSGSHVGSLTVQLVDTSNRDITSQEIVQRWRKLAGQFRGVDFVSFGSGPRGIAAPPIEFSLLARSEDISKLEAAVETCVSRLEEYPGVHDVTAGGRPGKWEYRLTVKDEAKAMGVSLAELSQTVRAAYYGDEAMRLQRGRHEVQLRVRYPREERESLANFDELRIRTSDGLERPLTELANIETGQSYSMIHRLDQMRSVTITADVDEQVGNAFLITKDLETTLVPELAETFPELRILWEGQQEQTNESMNSMLFGFVGVLIAMYFLLTIEFRSYLQPLLVLSIIPFGAVGAVAGHIIQDLPFTLFSIYGLVALSGIVVNDSIVLIDFINRRIADGMPLEEALVDAGRRRCRPVLLTSITTIGGMLPILLETSRQAQVLIPMATSLSFGLIFATALVLILAPVFYLVLTRSSVAVINSMGVETGQTDHPKAALAEPATS
ncbi:MAG: efflux RND transporter permease subunit [Planctomycetota bacterium]